MTVSEINARREAGEQNLLVHGRLLWFTPEQEPLRQEIIALQIEEERLYQAGQSYKHVRLAIAILLAKAEGSEVVRASMIKKVA